MAATTMMTTTMNITRVYTEHQPKFQRFLPDTTTTTVVEGINNNGTTPYGRQYAHVYHERLSKLAPIVWKTIEKQQQQKEDGVNKKVSRILELMEDVESTVVGTIVVIVHSETTNDGENNDKEYFLEDDSGRVALEFSNEKEFFVTTGVVVGITGTVGMDGVFRVRKLYTAHSVRKVPPTTTTIATTTTTTKNRQILLLSGLHCGSQQSSSLSRSMLLSYLHGVFGHDAEQVSQVIIAGGLIAPVLSSSNMDSKLNQLSTNSTMLQGCYELDAFVAQCTEAGIPVTIIPGKDDPTTAAWPQRPLHSSLLPRSNNNQHPRLLTRATNPYLGNMEQVTLIGTDGRNIPGLCSNDDTLDALQNILQFGHLCPSAPDSVPTVPSGDPFVLADDSTIISNPKIIFAGNSPKFASRLVVVDDDDTDAMQEDNHEQPKTSKQYCRLIALPKFEETGQAVLVNIDTLQVHVLQFQPGPCE